MKTIHSRNFAVCLAAGFSILLGIRGMAQDQVVSANPTTASTYSCVQRGDHYRVWQRTVITTNAAGVARSRSESYTELATGLCYLQNGQYVDTVEQINAVADGAEANQGRYQVHWMANANTPNGAVSLTTADNQHLLSTVYGLAYYDTASGSNVLLAQLQDCSAALADARTLVYSNAFSNLTADLRYTYRKAGMSQDVVLQQQPPPPSAFGLDPATTRLQVLTEFFNPPAPAITTNAGDVTTNELPDERILNFGDMRMGRGRAFLIPGQGGSTRGVPVIKHWTTIGTRNFLIEEVPYGAISNALSTLQSSTIRPDKSKVRRTVSLDAPQPRKVSAVKSKATVKLAAAASNEAGLLIDYDIVSGSNNITFQGDTTYYISDAVGIDRAAIFEGGTVVKFTNTTDAMIVERDGDGPIHFVFDTAPYRPAIFTSSDDDTVGSRICMSTGTPPATCIATYFQTDYGIMAHDARFSYAGTVMEAYNGDSYFQDCQFFECQTNAYSLNASFFSFKNTLMSRCGAIVSAFATGSIELDCENITADACTNILTYDPLYSEVISGGITNSILTGVGGDLSPFVLTDTVVDTSSSGYYQTVGAGSYYLVNCSTNRGAGTTNIDTNLLADLQNKTTWPPTNLSGSISSSVTFSPYVARDTNGAPDLGYHYDPIDYALSVDITNCAVEVAAGTALGLYGPTNGIVIDGGAGLTGAGAPTNPVNIFRYNTVQEQSTTNWSSAAWTADLLATNNPTNITLQFVNCSALAGDTIFNAENGSSNYSIPLWSSQFYNGAINGLEPDLQVTNCLFQRVALLLQDNASNTLYFYNNLFEAGSLTANHTAAGKWTFCDNLFDQATISQPDNPMDVTANNGSVTNFDYLLPTNVNDVVLPNSPAYEPGSLGMYYYPAGLQLINAGSRSALAAGLAQYAVLTNNQAEGASPVSIGYHYWTAFPAVTNPPANIATLPAFSPTFTVGAEAPTGLSYQWQFDGTNIGGATSTSYTVTNVLATNVGTYSVVVTDADGSTTNSATLTLNGYITNGLVAYWRMADQSGTNAVDWSGNGFNLPLFGTPTWGSNYVTFNGTNQYGDISGSAFTGQYNLDTTNLTICAWINKTASSQKGIVNKFASAGWSFQILGDTHLDWYLESSTPDLEDTGPLTIPLGEWTFVAMTWSNDPAGTTGNQVTYYINGIQNSQMGAGSTMESSSSGADIQVGNVSTGSMYAFDGSMRDVAIYSRLLSPAEIGTNFLNTEPSVNVPYPDLLYYAMTEAGKTNPTPVTLWNSATDAGITAPTNGTMYLPSGDSNKPPEWHAGLGSVSNGLHFNGSYSYLDTGDSTNFNFTTNLFTINFWIHPDSGPDRYIMQNGLEASNGWYVFLNSSSYQIDFGTETNGVDQGFLTGPGIPNDNWQMVTIVRTEETNAIIYFNGLPETNGTIISPSPSTNDLIFGVDATFSMSPNRFLDGDLWLPQIWRTNLSSVHIANLYLNQKSGNPWPTNSASFQQ